MKSTILLFATLILAILRPHDVLSQSEKQSHSFKIIGKTKVPAFQNSLDTKEVEYDSSSPDHLFISNFNKEGSITSKMRFRFNGKRFDLNNMNAYYLEKELLPDGSQLNYTKDGSIDNEDVMKEGQLVKRTLLYPDGKKKLAFSGDEKTLNGVYQMWHSSGQLSFSGNYTNNLKNGEFQLFDEAGNLIKKGVYEEGKLISGEAVVMNIVYEDLTNPAKYKSETEDLDGFFMRRSKEIEGLEKIVNEKKIRLNLTVAETGAVTRIETPFSLSQPELNILGAAFKELPEFYPGTVEDIPVVSILKLDLILSNSGIKINPEVESNVFLKVEEMPEFPGGVEGLRRYLEVNIYYPREAQKKAIEGKVYVNFVIDETGSVTNAKVARGVCFELDSEALRVVRSMPKWKPGLVNKKPVKVCYTVPIDFRLR